MFYIMHINLIQVFIGYVYHNLIVQNFKIQCINKKFSLTFSFVQVLPVELNTYIYLHILKPCW